MNYLQQLKRDGFVRHKKSCQMGEDNSILVSNNCTCGLSTILKDLQGQKKFKLNDEVWVDVNAYKDSVTHTGTIVAISDHQYDSIEKDENTGAIRYKVKPHDVKKADVRLYPPNRLILMGGSSGICEHYKCVHNEEGKCEVTDISNCPKRLTFHYMTETEIRLAQARRTLYGTKLLSIKSHQKASK